MKIIQTKGTVKDGALNIPLPELHNGEVEVIVISPDEPDEFDQRHQMMLDKGYDTPEKVLELIEQVKQEMLEEKGRTP